MKAQQLHFLNCLGFSSTVADLRPAPVRSVAESEIKTLESVQSGSSQRELWPLMGAFAAMTELCRSEEGANLRAATRELHEDEARCFSDKG